MPEVHESGWDARIGVVDRGATPPAGIRCLRVLLINPSKYDDDGYVMRFFRGVLPSNTLASLAGLTQDVADRRALGDVAIETIVLDEHVQKVRPERLARRHLRRGVRLVAALCGVQTNQFPRATDLARRFRAAGVPVMIGGFHVSGCVAENQGVLPPDLRAVSEEGITLVRGEVEDVWEDLLRDALHGVLSPFYDVRKRPDLSGARIPVADRRLMKRFAYRYMGTIDAGRGCPYRCSFCSIIAVQGNTMRHRTAEQIRDSIRENARSKIGYYFFTDDNFARNPVWEGIFDALIHLRTEEGIRVEFMMQVDVLAYRIPGFARKAAEAGCSQVFIGMESLNPANLVAAAKRQNRIEDFRAMVEAWRSHGIACHVGYIIGFPFDTPESVREDVRRLRDEVGVDQVSFFMLTPLPGSQDHAEMVARGEWIETDANRFDSVHATTRHPRMTATEWIAAFRNAWVDFYTIESMKAILSRANARTYWGLFKNFAWYRYATTVEGEHPMLCGFFRFRDRKERRPGFPVETFWRHVRSRAIERIRWARGIVALYFDLQEVWLATRGRACFQENLDELRRRYQDARAGAGEALHRVGDTGRSIAHNVRSGLGLRRLASRADVLAIRRTTRVDLDAYWRKTWDRLRHGRIHRINPLGVVLNFARDAKLCIAFNLYFLAAYGK